MTDSNQISDHNMKYTIRTAWYKGPVTLFIAEIVGEQDSIKIIEAEHPETLLAVMKGLDLAFAHLTRHLQRGDEIQVNVDLAAVYRAFTEKKFFWVKPHNRYRNQRSINHTPAWDNIRRHFMNGYTVTATRERAPDLMAIVRKKGQAIKREREARRQYQQFQEQGE